MNESWSVCPRCGSDFHCGANDPEPCVCMAVRLDEVTLAELRRRYQGCLCLRCLRELQADGARAEPPSA